MSFLSPWLTYLLFFLPLAFVIIVIFIAYIRYSNLSGIKKCTCTASLRGKTVLITGASAGIGKEAAKSFACRGARVIMACRNQAKADLVAGEIRNMTTNPNIFVKILDTSDMSSVRSFANEILIEEERIDVLVLNAGIGGSKDKLMTKDGLEVTMATNHFGHFLLVNLLLGLLKRSKPCRIIVTASQAHYYIKTFDAKNLNFELGGYAPLKAYSLSKLCNVMMAKYLAVYFEGKDVTVNSFCPGYVATEIFEKSSGFLIGNFYRWLVPFAARSLEDGVHTLIHLAISKEAGEISGAFFLDCKIRKLNHLADDAGLIKKVWEKSEDIVQLTQEELGLRNK